MRRDRSPLISSHQVYQRRLIPFVRGRHQVTKLFRDGKLKHILMGTKNHPRYLTTEEWVEDFVRKSLKPRTR